MAFKFSNSSFPALRLFCFHLFLAALFFGVLAGGAQTAQANPRYASLVIDADTGAVLHERYADKRLHPASLTKVMTLLLLFDELDAGTIDMNDRIYISRYAAGMVPSKLDLPAGSNIRVKDAIQALVTKSANDIAVAVAEKVGQSESRFATLMTRKARAIGMNQTVFKNASGLHDPGQITTARDMAKMARYVINRYPEYYKFFSLRNFHYRGKSYHNHNGLMKTYAGMDGMKTGYVNASGFNLIASAIRGNQRLIGVVFGGRTAHSRNAHMKKLLDQSFKESGELRIANAKVPLPGRKPALYAALASLNKIAPPVPAAQTGPADSSKFALLNTDMQGSLYSKIIGQGDYDPEEVKRLETGLMAIAAHTRDHTIFPQRAAGDPRGNVQMASFVPQMIGKDDARQQQPVQPVLHHPREQQKPGQLGQLRLQQEPAQRAAAAAPAVTEDGFWSIQIGAFTSRVATDQAIKKTVAALPAQYAQANPLIVPMRTEDGWVFRGRLHGYSKEDAIVACSYLKDCLPVSP